MDKTKSIEKMLNEYEKKGKNPLYLYVVKKSFFEEFIDESGEKDYESKSFIKGISLSSQVQKTDEFVVGKILVPYDYSIFQDKTISMDVLFIDLMNSNDKKFDEKVSSLEGLEQSDFIYNTFIDNYKKQYIENEKPNKKSILQTIKEVANLSLETAKEEINKIIPKDLSNDEKSRIVAGSMIAVGLLAMGAMGEDTKENQESYDDYFDDHIEYVDNVPEVQNPQEKEATYVVSGEDFQKKEPVISKKIEEVRKKVQDKSESQEKVQKTTKIEPIKAKPIELIDAPLSSAKKKLLETKLSIKGVAQYSERFDKSFANLIGKEGGYGTNDKSEIKKLKALGIDVRKIDQPTNFGVTQKTLKKLKKDFPHLYKDIDHVRDLTLEKVKFMCDKHYNKAYQIDEIKNDVLADQMLDIMYNHAYKTGRNKFIVAGINNLEKSKNKNAKEKSFKNWSEIATHINGLNELETANLGLEIASLRDDFMNEKGRVKQFGGLLKRSQEWVNISKQQVELAQNNQKSSGFFDYACNLLKSKD